MKPKFIPTDRPTMSFLEKIPQLQRRLAFWRSKGSLSPARLIAKERTKNRHGWADDVAAGIDLRLFDGLNPKPFHDVTPWEAARVLETIGLICQSVPAAVSLLRAARHVIAAKVPGDFVECGVYRGASAILIARALQSAGANDRTIWLYDTFEGMPKPTEADVYYTGHREIDVWETRRRGDGESSTEVYAAVDDVRANVFRIGYPQERFRFVKGKVEDTIPAEVPATIALLRLDTDYYESTRHELVHLYPRLSPGGVLILDDYGAYRGAQKAVDEFFSDKPILLARVDENVRIAVKH